MTRYHLASPRLKDPNENVMTSNWDANGNLLSTSNALPATTTYTYSAFTKVLTSTDPLGVTTTTSTTRAAPDKGRPLACWDYAVQYHRLWLDPARPGDLTQRIDAMGRFWQYFYDGYGVRNKTIDPLAVRLHTHPITSAVFIDWCRPRENVPGGNPTAYTTTDTSMHTEIASRETDPLGHVTSYKYDVIATELWSSTVTFTDDDGLRLRMANPVQVVRSMGQL